MQIKAKMENKLKLKLTLQYTCVCAGVRNNDCDRLYGFGCWVFVIDLIWVRLLVLVVMQNATFLLFL